MLIKCEDCGEDFTFIVENEMWWQTEEYKDFQISCPTCKGIILIKYGMPSEVAEKMGQVMTENKIKNL